MDTKTLVAVITAAASIIVAALSFAFNTISTAVAKRADRREALQQRKLKHYQELLDSISDLAIDSTDAANVRFAQSVNTIVLVAPQSVVNALMAFHREIRDSNPDRNKANHDKLFLNLVLEIRKSLELPFRDQPSTFDFHLVGARPANTQLIRIPIAPVDSEVLNGVAPSHQSLTQL